MSVFALLNINYGKCGSQMYIEALLLFCSNATRDIISCLRVSHPSVTFFFTADLTHN